MQYLTAIENKTKRNIELSKEELKFLYEINYQLEGFGQEKDPRIEEIKSKRIGRKDYAKIFNCDESKISSNKFDICDGKEIICFIGDIEFGLLNQTLENITFTKYLRENLYLDCLINAKNLTLPEKIEGSLYLNKLTNAENLFLPKEINGDLGLRSLQTAEGLTFPKKVADIIYLNSLKTAKGLLLPSNAFAALPPDIRKEVDQNPEKYYRQENENQNNIQTHKTR